jgi:c-di-GMP-binding flagellar brake protein YcgR
MAHRLFFFGADDLEGEATTVDLSTGGCMAQSAVEVRLGMVLRLSVFLPDQPWPLRIEESIVRWVKGRTFGVEFTGLRPAQRERLRAVLRNH